MSKIFKCLLSIFFFIVASIAWADISVPVHLTAEKGKGEAVGFVDIKETRYGLLFVPKLHDLKSEIHGFHIHEHPSCDDHGMAAGGHWDPKKTGKHEGPYNNKGHLGDLPALSVKADGTADLPVLAPRLVKLFALKNHVLMIHEGGDNYSDQPEKLGGGGKRMACGIIK